MNGRSLLLAFSAGLALAACAQPPVPQDQFYRLQVGTPEVPLAGSPLKGLLEVERFVADGLLGGRPIVFSASEQPHSLREYYYHFWVEAPTVMLRDRLVTYLRAAQAATTVVTPEMRVEPDFVLTGKIKRLERVIGAQPRAVVELDLGVRETASDRLLFLETYYVEVEVDADTVAAAVEAINEALNQIYARFTADLSRN